MRPTRQKTYCTYAIDRRPNSGTESPAQAASLPHTGFIVACGARCKVEQKHGRIPTVMAIHEIMTEMPISIKNDETELLARKLAELTGETIKIGRASCRERVENSEEG